MALAVRKNCVSVLDLNGTLLMFATLDVTLHDIILHLMSSAVSAGHGEDSSCCASHMDELHPTMTLTLVNVKSASLT